MTTDLNTISHEERLFHYQNWLSERLDTLKLQLPEDTDRISGEDALKLRHLISIGGTAASAIYGANPYRTAYDVYQEMAEEAQPFEGNYVTRRGLALERLVALRASEIMGRPLFMPSTQSHINLHMGYEKVIWERIDKDDDEEFSERYFLDMFSCQIDALTEQEDGKLQILECKTALRNPTLKGGNRLWGTGIEQFTDKSYVCDKYQGTAYEPDGCMPIPYHYYIQVQWQMLYLELQEQMSKRADGAPEYNTQSAMLAVDIAGSNDVRIYAIYKDAQLQQKLLQAATSFMFNNIMPMSPPLTFSVVAEPLKVVAPEDKSEAVLEADDTFINNYQEYRQYVDKIDELQEQAKQFKERLVAAIEQTGDQYKEVVDSQGQLLLKRTAYQTTKFNQQQFKKDHPELFAKYCDKSEQTRVNIY